MKINPYKLPATGDYSFYNKDKIITSKQWLFECVSLSHQINKYQQKNWLLCEEDLYQYSINFFALLLANKNIVLPQGPQPEQIQQAMLTSEIGIGTFENFEGFAYFHKKANSGSVSSNEIEALTINANNTITFFTSGSSGKPKAIKKFWYQLANEIQALSSLFSQPGDGATKSVVASVTHQHVYGLLFKLLWPVYENINILCETIEYPEQLDNIAREFTSIIFITSPSYLARTVSYFTEEVNQSISKIFSSGGALSATVAESFYQLNHHAIFEIYGSTETGGIAWRQQAIDRHWLLFPEHQVEWLNDETLMLTSHFLPKDENIKTDDRVSLQGRTFELLGRVDRIVKLYEKRLSLDEVERKLQTLSFVKASHCLLLTTNKLAVVIEVTEIKNLPQTRIEKKVLVEQCKILLKSLFDQSLLPRKWRFVGELPYNSQGKLVKSKIVTLFS
jgi:acyl-coenzyme A synthetase/AMP-(fatty) acid ligase